MPKAIATVAAHLKKIPMSTRLACLALLFVGLSSITVTLNGHMTANQPKHPTLPKAAPKTVVKPVIAAAPAATPPVVAPAKSSAAPATKRVVATTKPNTVAPQPVVTPSPTSSVSGLTPTAPTTTPTTAPSGGTTPTTPTSPPTTTTTTSYTSTNWSGYMASSSSYTAISGSWVTPHVSGNSTTETADSTWIGIGGVTTSDLIQVGTDNRVSASGQVSTEAFYEMLPNASQTVPGMTVTEGDAMTASLVQTAPGQWLISITDTTTGGSFTDTVSYSSTNSSAEWIEEDPSYSRNRQVPFDNFGSVAFTSGSATTASGAATIAGNSAQPITMVNSAGSPIATPSAIGSDGASFSVTN